MKPQTTTLLPTDAYMPASRYYDQELTLEQATTVRYLLDNYQQPTTIKGLDLYNADGLKLETHPQMVPSWWHWLEPGDVFDEFTVGQIYRTSAPSWLADMVAYEAEAMGTDIQLLFGGCMGAVAGAVDGQMYIVAQAERNWHEPPCIWSALIARSGAKKSPAVKAALKPLKDAMNRHAATDAALLKQYAIKLKQHENWMRELEKGDEPPPIDDMNGPRHPESHRYVLYDATTEALSEVLRHQKRGTLLHFDELARWMAHLEGKGKAATDRALYLELHDGGSRTIDRIGRGLNIHIPNWMASIVGGIQPTVLQQAMKDVPIDGLLQRFYPYVANPAKRATNKPRLEGDWQRFETAIERLTMQLPGPVHLSDEAAIVMEDLTDDLFDMRQHQSIPEPMQSHLSKWEGGVYRWLLVMHCFVCADQNIQPISVPVAAETARMVQMLHARLFVPNLYCLYMEVLDQIGHMSQVRWIAGHILSKGLNEFTVRDIYRVSRAFERMNEHDRRAVLRALDDAGWIQQADPDDRSLVPAKWLVNPHVHFYFARETVGEKKRRGDVVAQIRTR